MKRLMTILLLALLLAGCAAPEETGPEAGFGFTYNGVEIAINAEAAPIIGALGEPMGYTEEASCAFEGLDKTYYYGSFYLTTWPDGETDRVYKLWLVDDSAATREGIYIGASRDDVEAAYDAGSFTGDSCVLVKGDTKLTILFTDGVVSSIQYALVIE